jgi:hypothetical protein
MNRRVDLAGPCKTAGIESSNHKLPENERDGDQPDQRICSATRRRSAFFAQLWIDSPVTQDHYCGGCGQVGPEPGQIEATGRAEQYRSHD